MWHKIFYMIYWIHEDIDEHTIVVATRKLYWVSALQQQQKNKEIKKQTNKKQKKRSKNITFEQIFETGQNLLFKF